MPAPIKKNMQSSSSFRKTKAEKKSKNNIDKIFKNTSETLPKICRRQLAAVKAMVKRLVRVYLIHVFDCNLRRSQHFDVAVKLSLDLL